MKRILLILIFIALFGTGIQGQNDIGNLYARWVDLALLGKNQGEIEFVLRSIDQLTLEKVKQRLRFTVLENLRRQGLSHRVEHLSDLDDHDVAVRKILTEIRFVGMERDYDLKLLIKDNFGIALQGLY